MSRLFEMNAHGDIWQEPSLFDQGGPVPPAPAGIPADMAAARADHLEYLEELEQEQRRPLEELRRRLPAPRRVSPCLFELELEELEKVWGFEPSDLWNFTASTMRFMVRDLRASEDSVTG